MSIQVQNISKLFGQQKALNDVSFEIKKGEIVGFLGPNGAGKSTMMKIICSYLPQTQGRVMVCGKELLDNDVKIKNLIGYLPEHNPLYLDMYVKEFLSFIGGVHKIANKKERVQEMIEITGLQKEQHKKIGALSKGYRQRVGLAQAIIHDPEVLILDEPTTGLDPNQIVEIRDLIKKIGQEKTVMLSTHIMQEVEAICSRAIIINQGEIVADKDIESLKNIGEKLQLDVEFEHPIDANLLTAIVGVEKVINTGENQYQITCTNKNVRQEISKLALKENNIVLKLNQQSASLEQVFQNLTQQ